MEITIKRPNKQLQAGDLYDIELKHPTQDLRYLLTCRLMYDSVINSTTEFYIIDAKKFGKEKALIGIESNRILRVVSDGQTITAIEVGCNATYKNYAAYNFMVTCKRMDTNTIITLKQS